MEFRYGNMHDSWSRDEVFPDHIVWISYGVVSPLVASAICSPWLGRACMRGSG